MPFGWFADPCLLLSLQGLGLPPSEPALPSNPPPPPSSTPVVGAAHLGVPGYSLTWPPAAATSATSGPERSPPEGDRSEQCVNLQGQQDTIFWPNPLDGFLVLSARSRKEAETAQSCHTGSAFAQKVAKQVGAESTQTWDCFPAITKWPVPLARAWPVN